MDVPIIIPLIYVFQCWRLFQKLLPKFSHRGVHGERVLGASDQVQVDLPSQRDVLPIRRPVLPLQA